tara:strand:- start:728 stop:4285 length:3558 start_codon:yes stop_codon:yes gene_type:complete
MPVIAAAAAVVSGIGAAAAAIGGYIASMSLSTMISFGLQAVATVLGSKAQDKAAGAFDNGIKVNKIDPVAPIPVVYGRRTVGGAVCFRDTGGSSNKYLYQAMAVSEGEVFKAETVYINDVPTSTEVEIYDQMEPREGNAKYNYFGQFKYAKPGKFKKQIEKLQQKISVELLTGKEQQEAAPTLMPAEKWTANHKGNGLAILACRLEFDRDVYPNGIPQITVDLKGVIVRDPRYPTAAKAWSNNPALCVLDYMENKRYGCGITQDLIDEDSFIEAANYCDQEIDDYKKADGTSIPGQKRYTCNGVINTDNTCLENLNELLTCCRGMVIFSAGKYKLIIDKPEVSTFVFDESNIVGDWSITGANKRSIMNRVVSRYFSAFNNFLETLDIVADDEAKQNEDNDELHKKELRYAFTTAPQRAQFLSVQNLKQSRQGWTVQFTATLEGLDVEVGDVVGIKNSLAGWTDATFPNGKKFRVVEMKLESEDTIKVTATEYDGSVYSFDLDAPAEELDTSLPTSFVAYEPVNLAAATGTEHLQIQADGTIVARALLTWEPNELGYTSRYEIGFKQNQEPEARFSNITTSATSHYFGPLKEYDETRENITYDFRVRAVNSNGTVSDYVYLLGVKILGKSVPPTPATSFRFTQDRNFNQVFSFTPSQDLDVRGYVIRYDQNSNVWDNMTPLHTGVITHSPYETAQLQAGFYNFAIKTLDTSGNFSAAVNTSGTVNARNNITIIRQETPHAYAWNPTEDTELAEFYGSYVATDSGELVAKDKKKWSDLSSITWANWNNWIQDGEKIDYLQILDLAKSVSFIPFSNIGSNGTATTFFSSSETYTDDDIWPAAFRLEGFTDDLAGLNNRVLNFRWLPGETATRTATVVVSGSNETLTRTTTNNGSAPLYMGYFEEDSTVAAHRRAVFSLQYVTDSEILSTSPLRNADGNNVTHYTGGTGAWVLFTQGDPSTSSTGILTGTATLPKMYAVYPSAYDKSLPPRLAATTGGATVYRGDGTEGTGGTPPNSSIYNTFENITQEGTFGKLVPLDSSGNVLTNGTLATPLQTTATALEGRYLGWYFNVDSTAAVVESANLLLDGEIVKETNKFTTGANIAGRWEHVGTGEGYYFTDYDFKVIKSVQVTGKQTNGFGTFVIIKEAEPGNLNTAGNRIHLAVVYNDYSSAGAGTAIDAEVNITIEGY